MTVIVKVVDNTPKPTPTPIDEDWFYDFIFWGSERPEETLEPEGTHDAYIEGYPDRTVRPEGNITRAEAATMIARLMDYSLVDESEPKFSDTPSQWYNKYINAVVKEGLMQGYPDGTFRPYDSITRAEFAQMIKNIDDVNNVVSSFTDIANHWALDAINQAYGNKKILGYEDGTFRPDNSITRAEAVTMLNRLFDREVGPNGLVDVFIDVNVYDDLYLSHWAFYEILEASNTHIYSRIEKGKIAEYWHEIENSIVE